MYCILWIWVRKETDLINVGGEPTLIKEMAFVCIQVQLLVTPLRTSFCELNYYVIEKFKIYG